MTLNELELSLTNHPPSTATIEKIERLRAAAKSFAIAILREAPASREQSLAITKLEEAVMWAVKATIVPPQATLDMGGK